MKVINLTAILLTICCCFANDADPVVIGGVTVPFESIVADLSGYSLTSLPTSIGRLTNLQRLVLKSNSLTNLPDEMTNMASLGDLDVTRNSFENVPDVLTKLTQLSRLYLTKNRLKELPTNFGKLSDLGRFSADDNEIKFIPDTFANLVKLSRLELSNNQISNISSDLGRLESLKWVFFGSNKIRKLPSAVSNWKKLLRFEINDNRLTRLPEELGQLGITDIFMGNNRIRDCSKLFQPRLKVIKASNNLITDQNFPSIENYTRLRDLDISGNLFSKLPGGIGSVSTLVNLFVSNNSIESIMPLSRLTLLETLEAQNNNVKELFPNWSSFERLTTLSVGFNQIKEISVELLEISSLNSLYLEGNQFERLPTSLTKLTSLRDLSLGNSITCDCKLFEWYSSLVSELILKAGSGVDQFKIARCSSVNEYAGAYPQTLKAIPEAPCSHPTPALRKVAPRTATVEWTYAYPIESLGFFDPTEYPEEAASLRACKIFSAAGFVRNNKIFGFELVLSERSSGRELWNACFMGHELTTMKNATYPTFSYDLGDLAPATEYTVTVRAINIVINVLTDARLIFGPRSQELIIPTQNDVPLLSAKNLSVIGASSDILSIQWELPDASLQNGIITSFEVRISNPQTGESVTRSTSAQSYSFSRSNVDWLQANVSYLVAVRARTGYGSTQSSFGPWTDAIAASTCPENMRWEAGLGADECFATVGYFRDVRVVAERCTDLPGGSYDDNDCLHERASIDKIGLMPGFWRASPTSKRFLHCPVKEFCVGGKPKFDQEETLDAYCADNHTGVYCYGCLAGFFRAESGCKECQTEGGSTTLITLVVLIFCMLLLVSIKIFMAAASFDICCRCSRRENCRETQQNKGSTTYSHVGKSLWSLLRKMGFKKSDPERHNKARMKKLIDCGMKVVKAAKATARRLRVSTKIRLLLGFYQVLLSYRMTFHAGLDDQVPLVSLVDYFSNVGVLSLLDTATLKCTFTDYSFYYKLMFVTIFPFAFAAALFVICLSFMQVCKLRVQRVRSEFFNSCLFLLFLVYPSVSLTIFETFWCETFPDADDLSDKSALRADYTLKCVDTAERSGWISYAAFMVVVYPVGFVVLCIAILTRCRSKILKAGRYPEKEDAVKNVQFLIKPYKVKTFWFEVYELIRKLVQVSTPGFLLHLTGDPQLLPLISQNLTIVAIIVVMYFSPYQSQSDENFAVVSLVLLIPAAQISILDGYAVDTASTLSWLIVLELLIFLLFVVMDAFNRKRRKSAEKYHELDRRSTSSTDSDSEGRSSYIEKEDALREAVTLA